MTGQDRLKHIWPSDLLEKVKYVAELQSRDIKSPEFQFELTKEAAAKNFLTLKKYGLNLEKALWEHRKEPHSNTVQSLERSKS
jgi:hypothetical protein